MLLSDDVRYGKAENTVHKDYHKWTTALEIIRAHTKGQQVLDQVVP